MHGFQSCEYRYINLFKLQVIVYLIGFVVDNMHLIQNCNKCRLFYFVLIEKYVLKLYNFWSLKIADLVLLTTTHCCITLLFQTVTVSGYSINFVPVEKYL